MTSARKTYLTVATAGRQQGWIFDTLPDTASEAELESATREMVRGMFWGACGFDENDIPGSFARRMSRRIV